MYLLEVLCAMLRYHFSMYVALLFMRREVVMPLVVILRDKRNQ